MSTYRITPRAFDDLKSIARYTLDQWGEAQQEKYLRALDSRFSWLASSPLLGRHRPEIRDGYFSYLQGSHVVFYTLHPEGGISIIGVLHQAMDVDVYFSKP